MDIEFKNLHNYIDQNNPHDAKNYFLDLENILKKELPETYVDELILNCFDDSHGLLKFIKLCSSHKPFSDAVTEALEVLYVLITSFQKKAEQYIPQFRDLCLKTSLSDASNKVKRRSLEVFVMILEKSDNYPSGYRDLSDIYETLCNREAFEKEKTIRALVIEALAVLVRRHHSKLPSQEYLCNEMLKKLEGNNEAGERYKFFDSYYQINPTYEYKRVYSCIKKTVNTNMYVRSPQVCALNMMRNHMKTFADEVGKDLEFWEKKLTEFLIKDKGEIQKVSYLTTDKIYKNLPDVINSKDVFERYLNNFKTEIENPTSYGYKLKLAIRGFGYFSRCFKRYFPDDESIKIFMDMILRIEKIYLIDFDPASDDLNYLPDYIQSLSNIVEQLENISEYAIGVLQKVTILLIRLYPHLSSHHHNLVIHPILTAYIYVLKRDRTVAKKYLREVTVEGVIFSSSHEIAYDLIESDAVTYKNFVPLWVKLLTRPADKFELWNIEEVEAEKILDDVTDEFFQTLFELITKLNLTTEKIEEAKTDIESCLKPVKVNDFNIFVNLVDLYVDVMKELPAERFRKWLQFFLKFNMNKSTKNPLVSGFYKLIAVALNVSKQLDYFSEERLSRDDINELHKNIEDFLDAVMVKIKSYKDDLKLSCVKLILSSPIDYITKNLNKISPVVVSLFAMARNNLDLAKLGLESLEYWRESISDLEQFDEFVKQVVPTFETFLSSKSLNEKSGRLLNYRKTKQVLSKRKVVTTTDSDLLKVQKGILSFLGNVSADVCASLIENNSITTTKEISTDLDVTLNYDRHKIPIHLQKFLPRIIELALNCSERKLQITSCEVLHGIVIVLIGSDAKEFDSLLRYVLYPSLQLGCNADNTVKQIFEPLMVQLVHWYASPKFRNTRKVAVTIEALMDALTQEEDTSLRDFSCSLIREFAKFSLINVKERIEDTMTNVKVLLRKIKQFSHHPDSTKKLAACLIFNSIFPEINEEVHIIDTYWLEIFGSMILNVTQIDEVHLEHVVRCFDNLESVFKEREALFKKSSRSRRQPADFPGDTLKAVLTVVEKYLPLCNSKEAKKRLIKFYYEFSDDIKVTYPDLSPMVETVEWVRKLSMILENEISICEYENKRRESNRELLDALAFCLKIKPDNNLKELLKETKKLVVIYSVTIASLLPNKEIVKFINENVLKLLIDFIFNATYYLNDNNHEETVKDVLSKINVKGIDIEVELNQYVQRKIGEGIANFDSSKDITLTQRQFIKGLALLKECNCYNENIGTPILSSVLNYLFDDQSDKSLKLSRTTKKYFDSIIDLCLREDFSGVVSNLINKTEIYDVDVNKTITRGRYVYGLFKEFLLPKIVENFSEFTEILLNGNDESIAEDDAYYYIDEILDYFNKNKNDLSYEEDLKLIVSKWWVFESFKNNGFELKRKGLKLLQKISNLMVNDIDLGDADVENVRDFIASSFDLSSYRILPQRIYQYVNDLLNSLPVVLNAENDEIWNKSLEIQDLYFRDVNDDLKVSATLTVNKSFQLSIKSRSKLLFMFACGAFIKSHLRKDVNLEFYCSSLLENVSDDVQYELLKEVHHMCSSGDLTLKERYDLADLILVNLLRYSNYENFERFYVEIIRKVVVVDLQNNDFNEEIITKKTIAFILVRCLFSRIITDNFEDASCVITEAAFDEPVSDGKQLLRTCTKIASAYLAVKIDDDLTDDAKELLRLSKCQCYNAFISIISNCVTSSTESVKRTVFYNMLFNRTVNEQNLLWRNIMNSDKKYVFPLTFDVLPQKSKILVNIRTERREMRRNNDVNYLQSQIIFNSTLNDNVTLYDFSRSTVRSQTLEFVPNKNLTEMEVTIDGDEINYHECLPNICGLIRKIDEEKIYEDAPNPKWIVSIGDELRNPDTPINVKLFLLKVIEKTQNVFKPYGSMLVDAIVNLIVTNSIGDEIGYFVSELIIMVTSWDVEETIKRDSFSRLLEYLIKNMNQERTDIKLYHLNLIKIVVESTKDIEPPYDYLTEKLNELKSDNKIDVVVRVICILLANNIVPWRDEKGVKLFARRFGDFLDSNSVSIKKNSAETIGMALRCLELRNDPNLESFSNFIVTKKLKTLTYDKLLPCLQALSRNYPKVCDHFINRLIYNFDATPAGKTICMKLFLERIDTLLESPDYKMLNLKKLINDYDDQNKTIGVEILKLCLGKIFLFDANVLPELIDDLTKLIGSDSAVLRNAIYEFFVRLYDFDGVDEATVKKVKLILLKGLCDSNDEIREKIESFWTRTLPDNFSSRFNYILKNMYDPSIEEYFPTYAVKFLLKEIDLTEKIFNKPLEEQEFFDYQIKDNWRTRLSTQVPLFASTYKSQLFTQMSLYTQSDAMETEYVKPGSLIDEKQKLLRKDDGDKGEGEEEKSNKIRKMRFQKDLSRSNRDFALFQIEKKATSERKRLDQIKSRQEQVNIYRSYRKGEIPDVEITLNDIFAPLQKLIENDVQAAQILYMNVFRTAQNIQRGDLNEIAESINAILNSSEGKNMYLISGILDVIVASKEIKFSSDTISRICGKTGLLASGVLLLEEYLMANDEEPPAKRSAARLNTLESDYWIKMADLYKKLEDWDSVRAIFLTKLNSDEIVIKAIDAESQKLWRDAQHFYFEAIKNDQSLDRRDFYYESYYKCFAELSDWENLSKSIKLSVEGDDDLWDDDWNKTNLLPWYVTAELRNSLSGAGELDEFISFLNAAMRDNKRGDYVKANFMEELAFMYLITEKYDFASFYLGNNLERFLDNWQSINPVLMQLRMRKLLKIKNSVDLYNYLNKPNVFKTWISNENNFNDISSSIVPLESKNFYRSECLRLSQMNGWRKIKHRLDFNLLQTALSMKNFHVARKYLKGINENDLENNTQYKLFYSKLLVLKANISNIDPESKINLYAEAYKNLNEIASDTLTTNEVLSIATTKYDLFFDVDRNSKDLNRDDIKSLFNVNLSEDINDHAYKMLEKTLKSTNELNDVQVGNAYVKLAKHAQKLHNDENLIESVLKGMQNDSIEARQMFPCLLDVDNILKHKHLFVFDNIPTWYFIQWIPQLLSKLDTDCVFIIDKIVSDLSAMYPQAIMYSYRLAKEKLDCVNVKENVKGHLTSLLDKLDELLLSEPSNNLIKALSNVATPGNLLLYHVNNIKSACHQNDAQLYQKHLQEFKDFSSMKGGDIIGPVHKDSLKMSTDFKALTGKFDPKKYLKTLDNVVAKIQNEESKSTRTTKHLRLSYYSPFLENYTENLLDKETNLEIPGQYLNNRFPLPQHHAKIFGFSPEIKIMSSIRKPIRISIIGSDGKEYPYLIKIGEDLRQDQRIQQIFNLINDILNGDASCREHRLKISTYQVSPLTCNLGLIQWVNDTECLKNFLIDSSDSCDESSLYKIREFYTKKYTGTNDPKKIQYEKALNKSRDDVVSLYNELVNKVPYDVFRRALQNMSTDAETFIALRTNFMTSYVSSCISNWILGIGDRHLSNTMVCLKDARTMEIDFGHAFGTGVQLLSIPELVPFRLTPHLLDVTLPLREYGLVEETMVYVLRAIREKKDAIMSTVKVFVNEPSMDWIKYKKSENNLHGVKWNAEEKIAHTERKLTGANPVEIMIEELRNRKNDSKDVIEKFVRHVSGDQSNFRYSKEGDLTVEDQVKCLLDHATDPNLLCRMFSGWESWI